MKNCFSIGGRTVLAAFFVGVISVSAVTPGIVRAQSADETAVVEGPTSELVITTGTGIYPFQVEIAATPETRSRGLMYRRSMPDDHGMLFDMGGVGEATFWMENTHIALDIIFLDYGGRVVKIAQDAQPNSRALISSGGPVRYVLELKAGSVRLIGLKLGDVVRHEIIRY